MVSSEWFRIIGVSGGSSGPTEWLNPVEETCRTLDRFHRVDSDHPRPNTILRLELHADLFVNVS